VLLIVFYCFRGTPANHSTLDRVRLYLAKNNLFRKFNLRVHKFAFQWELAIHLFVCILSLSPFFFTGRRLFAILPISVWAFYNVLFFIGPQHSNLVIPRFGKFKHSFTATIEDFFSPKLLPVLSISFLCVVLSLTVTGTLPILFVVQLFFMVIFLACCL
jgi:hypothetical protein